MSTPIPPKVKGTVLVALVVFLGGAYIKDEIHNHTAQGHYETCIHQTDLDTYRAGHEATGADLATMCSEKTGYNP